LNSFRRIFQITILFLLFTYSQPSYSQQRDKSFDTFWSKFRKAVIDKNYDTLKSLTQFPLIVKGTLDGDPIKRFKSDKFIFIFKHYLKQNNTTVTGNALDDIVETEIIPDKDFSETHISDVRFSDMEFKRINGKWKLYFIYIETSYQEENNIK